MIFADYINTLKGHYKQKISNDVICGILFDSIIEPADLKNRNGDILTIDKAEISRIMNQKKNIPAALQEHVHDAVVLNNIEDYFTKQIVTKLVSDRSDLCHQLMNLIDVDENISTSHKEKFRRLAN